MRPMVAAFALALSALTSLPVFAQPSQPIWVGTWATAPVALPPPSDPSAGAGGPLAPARIHNQTIRQIVHTSVGGTRVRVALTNTFGTAPLEIGAAHVALRDEGPAIDRSAAAALTFRGKASATIEAGSMMLSDPVDLAVPPLADLVIDLYLPEDSWTRPRRRRVMAAGSPPTTCRRPATMRARLSCRSSRPSSRGFISLVST